MSQVLIAIVDDEQPVRDATKALAACSRSSSFWKK
jgi:FixJ family two-component response regulator